MTSCLIIARTSGVFLITIMVAWSQWNMMTLSYKRKQPLFILLTWSFSVYCCALLQFKTWNWLMAEYHFMAVFLICISGAIAPLCVSVFNLMWIVLLYLSLIIDNSFLLMDGDALMGKDTSWQVTLAPKSCDFTHRLALDCVFNGPSEGMLYLSLSVSSVQSWVCARWTCWG